MRSAAIAALAVSISLCSPPSAASQGEDEPVRLTARVGGIVLLCRTGTIVCPAANGMCDDTTVAVPEITPADGMGFRGLKLGSTLCSAGSRSGSGERRVYRVDVVK